MLDISRPSFAKQINHMELIGPKRSLCVNPSGFKGENWDPEKGVALDAQGHTRR